MHPDAALLVRTLELGVHPEGGFYRETFRSPLAVAALSWLAGGEERSASTAIYFLLPAGTFSAIHRVMADEVWHHYDGDPLDLHTFDERGTHEVVRLGRNVAAGERPQCVVPGGVYQAAVPLGERYALCGCTVAPGFDFADFSMPARDELVRAFPRHRALVEALTRVSA